MHKGWRPVRDKTANRNRPIDTCRNQVEQRPSIPLQNYPPNSPNGFLGDRKLLECEPSADRGLASFSAFAHVFKAYSLLACIAPTSNTEGEVGYAIIQLILSTENPVGRMYIPMEPGSVNTRGSVLPAFDKTFKATPLDARLSI